MDGAIGPGRRLDIAALIKESLLTGVVVFALCISLVAFKVADVPGGLAIETRLWDVAMCVLIGICGRILLILHREGRFYLVAFGSLVAGVLLIMALAQDDPSLLPFDDVVVTWIVALTSLLFCVRAAVAIVKTRGGDFSTVSGASETAAGQEVSNLPVLLRYLGIALFAFALVFPFLPFVDRRFLDLGILALTYIMLGWGLNIVVGLAGLLDLGYVAFYAVGAYSYALLATEFGVSFWLCLPFAGIMAAFAGILLGFPVLRLRGDYLAIVTLGFGEMVRIILLNWYEFTKGPDGIGGISRPSFFGLEFSRRAAEGEQTFHQVFGLDYMSSHKFVFLYFIILALAMLTNLFTQRIRKLPVGRAWEALREDEIACRSLGINPRNTKLTAFAIGAMFGGFAGSFFATRQTFISPESFVFLESAIILGIVVLGGFGSQIGVVLATGMLIVVPEIFRELQQYRMLAFGAAMVLVMVWRPAGLVSHRDPTIRLRPPNADGGGP